MDHFVTLCNIINSTIVVTGMEKIKIVEVNRIPQTEKFLRTPHVKSLIVPSSIQTVEYKRTLQNGKIIDLRSKNVDIQNSIKNSKTFTKTSISYVLYRKVYFHLSILILEKILHLENIPNEFIFYLSFED